MCSNTNSDAYDCLIKKINLFGFGEVSKAALSKNSVAGCVAFQVNTKALFFVVQIIASVSCLCCIQSANLCIQNQHFSLDLNTLN